METLYDFLFRSSIAIGAFYLVYWALLKNTTHFSANRIYLLGALLTSLLIAIFPVSYEVIVEAATKPIQQNFNGNFTQNEELLENDRFYTTIFTIPNLIIGGYLLGVTFFLLRLIIQTWKPIQIIIKQTPKEINEERIYESPIFNLPFSFFNKIFINPNHHKQEDLDDIFAHEKVHIRERHWIDLLIIELLTVIFWFNPFIWLFEHSIKQNHEYLADEGVLSRGQTPVRYQALLVNQLMGMQVIRLSNSLHFALGPNRLKMMTKQKTSKRKLLRLVWFIPIFAGLLVAFAQPEYKQLNADELSSSILTSSDSLEITSFVTTTKSSEYKFPDGSKIYLEPKSKVKFPKKFKDDARAVVLEGEAYFEIAKNEKPFTVYNEQGEILFSKKQSKKTQKIGAKNNDVKIETTTQSKEKMTVRGTVKDESGNLLPGASVIIKGTSIGTVSDMNGKFVLENPNPEITKHGEGKNLSYATEIVTSFVGYESMLGKVGVSGDTKEKGSFTFKLKKSVILIDSKSMFLTGDVPPPPPPPAPEIASKDGEVFMVVEDLPKYPGGFYKLGQYVKAKKGELQEKSFFSGKKIKGKATVGFTINTKGQVANIQVIEKNTDFAAQALSSIVKGMKNWSPGKQRGKAVSVDYAMELEF